MNTVMYSSKDWAFNQIGAYLWRFLSISAFVSIMFCNFGRNPKLSLFIGGLRDNAIFEVTNWKPSDFRILPQPAYCKTTRR